MPEEVAEKAIQELKRLESMPPMSAEATVSRNYLDWLIAVPVVKKTKESRDLKRAEQILNEDHYGLEKIKDRILRVSSRSGAHQEAQGHDSHVLRPAGSRQERRSRSRSRAR